jgi:hypothetical protein
MASVRLMSGVTVLPVVLSLLAAAPAAAGDVTRVRAPAIGLEARFWQAANARRDEGHRLSVGADGMAHLDYETPCRGHGRPPQTPRSGLVYRAAAAGHENLCTEALASGDPRRPERRG